jgi:hypothetical protein
MKTTMTRTTIRATTDSLGPLRARAADGSAVKYRCEMRGATVLRRSGWTPEMFVRGEPIKVQGAPDRVDPLACYVNTLVLANGRTLTARMFEMQATALWSARSRRVLRRSDRRVARPIRHVTAAYENRAQLARVGGLKSSLSPASEKSAAR